MQNQKKLLLLHGLAIAASRKQLSDLKEKFSAEDILTFTKGFKEDDLRHGVMNVSMFTTERLVILENPGDEFTMEKFQLPEDTTLVIWVDHELSATKKLLKFVTQNQGQVMHFPEGKEVSIFPLLDLLATKNPKAFLELEKVKQAGFDVFYILTMVLYLLRNLVASPKNAPPFVQEKLLKQRKNFSKKQIKEFYKTVLEIDYKLKTGNIEKPQAEFLLTKMFVAKQEVL